MKQVNRKKKGISLCVVCLLLAVMVLGCGSSKEEAGAKGSQKTEKQGDESQEKDSSKESYMMEVNGVQFGVNTDSESVVEALGEPEDYFEGESCVSLGLAKYYRYPGFNFSTYEEDGKHLIDYISVTEENITTAEGIGLGSAKNDVLKAYGNDTGDMQDVMKYEKGDMTLRFWIEGEKVSGLELQKNWPESDTNQQPQGPVCCP